MRFFPCVTSVALLAGCLPLAFAQDYQIQLLQVPSSLSGLPIVFSTTVTGVNSSGVVAGYFSAGPDAPYPPAYPYGFTYQKGTYQQVTASEQTWISGINDSGEIIGYFDSAQDESGCFTFNDAVFKFFDESQAPEQDYASRATGINNSGEIVGSSFDWNTAMPAAEGFTIIDHTTTTIAVKGQQYTYAQGVNDEGVVVGYYGTTVSNETLFHGFIYKAGAFSPLNYPGSTTTMLEGINNNGVIVGTYVLGDGSSGQFIHDKQGFHPFSFPNATNTTVTGINNQGVVYGSVTYGPYLGQEFGFVATPVGAGLK
jgi:hypothetical protein